MSSKKILLEIPVFSPEAALKAAEYGADRLELCSSFSEGGLIPGAGFLAYLKQKIEIPVNVMIRPREGNFVYSKDEIDVMAEEICIFSSIGADGFVFGVLNEDGRVNKDACLRLVETAEGKPCTFHRAFDASSNLKKSLLDIIECGFHRILTSGGKASVGEALPILKKLLKEGGDEIIIMPGGGMAPEFIDPLKETGYLKEVHASCKKIIRRKNLYQNDEIQFSSDSLDFDETLTVDSKKVEDFKRVL